MFVRIFDSLRLSSAVQLGLMAVYMKMLLKVSTSEPPVGYRASPSEHKGNQVFCPVGR